MTATILNYSTNLILVPAFIAAVLGRWIDFFVIMGCAAGSIMHHATYSPTTFAVDQITTYILIIRTFFLAIGSLTTIGLYILGFGYMVFMYLYGKTINRFAFDPRQEIADMYHASMHIIGIIIYSASMIWLLP